MNQSDMKIKALLTALIIAISGVFIPANAQTQKVLEYGKDFEFYPNGRTNEDRQADPTYTDGDWNAIIEKIFRQQDGVWDSHNDKVLRTDQNGNESFGLKFKQGSISFGDKIEIELTFADKADAPIYFWIDALNDGRRVVADDNFKLVLEFDVNEAALLHRTFNFYGQDSQYKFTAPNGDTYSAMRLKSLKITVSTKVYNLEKWKTFYNQNYNDYTLKHTLGWVDNQEYTNKDAGDRTDSGINIADGNFITDNRTSALWDADGKYVGKDKDTIPKSIDVVDFSYIDGYDPIAEVRIDGKRQRTYTVVHDVTVFPGERIDLNPFSDLHKMVIYGDDQDRTHYDEDYIRWYDYQTDKRSDYLYFFQDPRYVATTQFGHIGGKAIFDAAHRSPIAVASFIAPAEGLGEKEVYIAADFSMQFSQNYKSRFAEDNGKKYIWEPTVVFRHIFHIRTAKKTAEEFNGNGGGNNAVYVAKNRRVLSARAGALFTVRLDNPMPDPESAAKESGSDVVFTGEAGAFTDSDGKKYGRVRQYGIKTYRYDGEKMGQEMPGMFERYERSAYTTMTNAVPQSMIEEFRDKGSVYWESDKQKFYRAIRCSAAKATAGKYLVRIVAQDSEGKQIAADGSKNNADANPLIIQEYIVEFLPEAKASLLTETEYNGIKANPSDSRYTHTEDYLEQFSDNKQVVNFDEYNNLPDIFIAKYQQANDNQSPGHPGVEARLVKLPMRFDKSNYGFSYNIAGDYNVYKIIDHSDQAPFQNAISWYNKNNKTITYKTHGLDGLFDRLYYNTGGQKRGFMYYVNAASDPGEIASLHINTLCNGTTIYVSAWMNELTDGEPETANVVFNFRATVKDKTGNVVKHATLHGYSSGYVKRGDEAEPFEIDSPNKGNDYTPKNGGLQSQWMHIYYSFVPNLSPINEYVGKDDYTIEYDLVLENNCVSSVGADYAVDDIRMYIVPPRVSATQARPVCDLMDATDNDRQPATIKIDMPFESLLNAAGLSEGDTEQTYMMQYAILDKVKYDAIMAQKNNTTDAFIGSVLRYPHRHIVSDKDYDTNSKKDLPWGTIQFYTDYEKNLEFDNTLIDNPDGENAGRGFAKREILDGERSIVFLSTPMLANVSDGQEYYIVVANFDSDVFQKDTNNATFYTEETKGECDKKLAALFDLESMCARKATFRIKGPAQIIIDGFYQADGEQITCCKNQRPVVQVDLYGKNTGFDEPLEESSYVDWYYGSYSEFSGAKMEDGTTLFAVLGELRKVDATTATWDVETGETGYTAAMRDYLKGLCDGGKLSLYQSSFVFPSTSGVEENGEKYVYVTAIPIAQEGTSIDVKNFLCTSPTEVRILVDKTAPSMFNGFNSGDIQYPMEDVALRVGLNQLGGVSGPSGAENGQFSGNPIYDNTVGPVLWMPLRDVTPAEVTGNYAEAMQRRIGNPYVFLAATDDPDYQGLGLLGSAGNDVIPAEGYVNVTKESLLATSFNYEESTIMASQTNNRRQGNHIGYTTTGDVFAYHVFFPYEGVYTVTMLYAKGNDNNTRISLVAGENSSGEIAIEQTDGWNSYVDKEIKLSIAKGGNYTLKLNIIEQALNITDFKFKYMFERDYGMKVVGELTEVNAPVGGETPMAKIKFYNDCITFREGRYYKFKFAYEEDYGVGVIPDNQPCNGETVFTVKVVPEYQMWTGAADKDGNVNWNNDANWRRVTHDELLDKGNEKEIDGKLVTDGDNEYAGSFAPMDFTKVVIPAGTVYPQLAKRTHDRLGETTGKTVTVNNGYGTGAQAYTWTETAPASSAYTNGSDATKDIQYDMASVLYGDAKDVYCRLWYANAADEIHFNSNAEILNQQYLDYRRAWVDMEMESARWYTASSPLQGMVAGDMYLPTDGARQQTVLFKDITFDKSLNDRFRPAVYQRGWDKGSANVYELPTTSVGPIKDVAVALNWSEVYNDVQEKYAAGIGYSVKTDVSELTNKPDKYVKFRFPKADEAYDYWTYDGDESGRENGDEIDREKAYKLHELDANEEKTVTLKNVSGVYFLAGNPFMAHLDMNEFFRVNSGLEKKYWIMTASGNQVNILNPQAGWETTDLAADGAERFVAPMQGFFVKKAGGESRAEENETLDIKFTPAMMAVKPYVDNDKKPIMRSRSEGESGLMITAGDDESRALLLCRSGASAGYLAAEDAEALTERDSDTPQVYTVGGNRALSINTVPAVEGTEIGLMTTDDSAVTVLRFDGTDGFDDLSLYDAATGDTTPLSEGMTYTVKGRAAGRLYLVKQGMTAGTSAITITRDDNVLTVVSGAENGDLTVRVYDTLGRVMRDVIHGGQIVNFSLEAGAWIIEAQDGVSKVTRKFMMR